MRKGFFAPAFFVLLLGSCGPPEPDEVEIRLTPHAVQLNGEALVPGWKPGVIEEQLGKAGRSDLASGPNDVLVYDAMGLKIFLSEPTSVTEVQVTFQPNQPDRLDPKGRFRGKLLISGVPITPATTPEELALLRGWHSSESVLDHCYHYSTDAIYIYFQYNDAEDQLTDLSFGRVEP